MTAPPAIVPAKTAVSAMPPAPPPPSATAALPPTATVAPKNAVETDVTHDVPTTPGTDSVQPTADATTATSPSATTVELRGVMQKEGGEPRFRVDLNAPGGRNRTMDIILGETVYGPWKALEYSAASKKLILSNTRRLVVLDTGEKVDLPE